jgi:hypothetical protein
MKATPIFGKIHPSKRSAMLGAGSDAGSRDRPRLRAACDVVHHADMTDAAVAIGEVNPGILGGF